MTFDFMTTYIYLAIHGFSTVGAIIIFLIRNENRLTKVEITLQLLKDQHDKITKYGTLPHINLG